MTTEHRASWFWALLMIGVGLVLLLLPAAPAAAQGTFICTGAPGERQVGMTQAGNGVAAAPICVRDQPSQPAPPPVQMRAVDNYYAAAWHSEANDVWISGGFQSKDRAARAALSACNQAMGGGCTIAASNVNGSVAIGRGTTGQLYVSERAKRGDAEKAVKAYCRTQNDECEVINWATLSPGFVQVGAPAREKIDIFAPRGNPRRSYGAIAWVDGNKLSGKAWIADVWVVAGRPSAAKAQADVQAMCQADMGPSCKVALTASDVFVAVTERDGKEIGASSGPSVEIANRRAMDACKRTKGKCRITSTFTLSQDAMFRFDPLSQGKDYFSAQAWTKGTAKPWDTMVWSVTGAKSEAEAKQAALSACTKDSKQECEIGSNSFNSRVAVYLDNNGAIRVSYIERDADPAAEVAKKCVAAKVTCRIIKVVDGRVPLTERIEVR